MNSKPEKTMFAKKKRRGSASPAACLLPQIEANLHRRYGSRRRDFACRDDDSPGKSGVPVPLKASHGMALERMLA